MDMQLKPQRSSDGTCKKKREEDACSNNVFTSSLTDTIDKALALSSKFDGKLMIWGI